MTNISEGANEKVRIGSTARGEAQRQALVREAYGLIAEGGFERLRTREVAARAGVNTATLHYYFATKEDLIRGVADRLLGELSTVRAPSIREGVSTPLGELRGEFADEQTRLRESPETHVVLFELYLRSLRDPTLRDILETLDAAWRRHIEAYLTEGVQQGAFRPDLDVPAAAASVMVFVKGSIWQSMTNPQAFPADRVYAQIERWITNNTPSAEPA